jgi:hypothetical protein
LKLKLLKKIEKKLVKTWWQIVPFLNLKPINPHFSTTPADFEAETHKKENEKKNSLKRGSKL